jgi:hypothetical protein
MNEDPDLSLKVFHQQLLVDQRQVADADVAQIRLLQAVIGAPTSCGVPHGSLRLARLAK